MKQKIDVVLEKILIAIMAILVVDVLWQVLVRFILSSEVLRDFLAKHKITLPNSFTDELAGFLLIWVGVLGAAYVTGKKEHLAIDLLIQKSTPERQKKLIRIVNVFIALFAIFVMIIGGSWLVITRFQFGVASAAMHLPLGYVYSVLPLSGLLMLYYSLVFISAKEGEVK